MSLISEIKCARCDRKYSGVRSRCPYCGARRIGRGKYTEDADNTKGKMLISVLIMGCLVVAVGVLFFTDAGVEAATPPVASDVVSGLPDPEDITSMPGANQGTTQPDPSEIDEPEEPEPASPSVSSIRVLHNRNPIRGNDFTQPLGVPIVLDLRIEPVGVEEVPVWSSSDTSVFEVVPTNPEGTSARVTGVGAGRHATLTVSVGGLEEEVIVRISR